MSDSQSKIEKRRQEARERKQLNAKRAKSKVKPSTKRNLIVAVCVLLLVVLVGGLFFSESSLLVRKVTAMTIGKTKISAAEYSYYYLNSYGDYVNTMSSYFGEGYVGIDNSVSLKRQEMYEGQTYAEYFSEEAIKSLQQMVALSEEAKANGYVLSEEELESYNTMMESMESNAELYGVSVDEYMETICGKGFNKELYEKLLYRELMAYGYLTQVRDSYEYSVEDLEAYYTENIDNYAMMDYRYQAFMTAEETEDTEAVTLEDAKAAAEEFLAKVDNELTYSKAALELAESKLEPGSEATAADNTLRTGSTKTTVSAIDANLAEWVFAADRAEGDCEIVEDADGNGYYVVYIVKTPYRDEYITRDARHILISVAEDAEEEVFEEGKAKIEEIYEEWKEGEATEDSFAELAEKYSNDTSSATGGLLYDLQDGEMVSEVNDWIFDESREYGDVEILQSSYGYHLMFYMEENDTPYWQRTIDNAMRDADYEEWYEELIKDYEVDEKWFGMQFRQEPIGN